MNLRNIPLLGVALSGLLATSAALAIAPPTEDHTLFDWYHIYNVAAGTTDDIDSAFEFVDSTIEPDLVTPCDDPSWPTLPNQGARVPASCGKMTFNDGSTATYTYFQEPSGGFRFTIGIFKDDGALMIGRVRSDAQAPTYCPLAVKTCDAADYMFCGSNTIYENLDHTGAKKSTGRFQFCVPEESW